MRRETLELLFHSLPFIIWLFFSVILKIKCIIAFLKKYRGYEPKATFTNTFILDFIAFCYILMIGLNSRWLDLIYNQGVFA